jgi:hypothetical protein
MLYVPLRAEDLLPARTVTHPLFIVPRNSQWIDDQ